MKPPAADGLRVGRLYLLAAAGFFLFGGLLALGMRWKLAWPESAVPVLSWFHDWPGGMMPADTYAKTFTLHGTLMLWLVVVPAIAWGLGLACVPSLLGSRLKLKPMAEVSFWWMLVGAATLLVGWASAGWTAYAPLGSAYETGSRWVPYAPDAASWLRLSLGKGFDRRQAPWPTLALYATTLAVALMLVMPVWRHLRWAMVPPVLLIAGVLAVVATTGLEFVIFDGQTAWFFAVGWWAIGGGLAAMPILVTVATRPTHGRLPLAVWGWTAAAAIGLLAGPVLVVAMTLNLLDAHGVTGFFDGVGGGQPLLHQHLFWFYGHPLVYLMILPAYGLVSDALSRDTGRDPRAAFAYWPAALSLAAISFLGFAVWAHHMFQSGLDPSSALVFSAATILIATPSAVLVIHWIGTIWTRKPTLTTAGWGAIAFVSLFVVGGLSGLILAAPAINVHLHDTYFVVAHLHYTLFGGAVFGLFVGLYSLWPILFPGRRLSEGLAKAHLLLTYLSFNGTFGAMHLLGMAGMPRRYADPTSISMFAKYAPYHEVMTVSAIVLGAAQLLLALNIAWSLLRRRNGDVTVCHAEGAILSGASTKL